MNNPISPEDIVLVKNTWNKVIPIADTAATLFYERLLDTHPELAPMFAGVDMPGQRKKLVKAISLVVTSLDHIETLLPVIRDLGRRHSDYGVRDEHYAQVGSALLWTLQTGLGDHWSDEAANAWSKAYQLLADTMIDAANSGERSAA